MKRLIQFSANDIKSRYSGSIFGAAWALVLPLTTILVFWYVFELGFKNLPVGDAPFILWFSAGYIPWVFVSDVITSGTNSLIEYSYLVKKIKFNTETIPLMKLLSAFFIHCFFIAFLLCMSLILKYRITIHIVQIAYYAFAGGVLSLGLVYFFSAVTVFFRDTSSIVNVLIQIGFWVTPIMWNEKEMVNASVRKVLALNPVHYIVQGYRNSLTDNRWFWEDTGETVYFWCLTAVIFIIGLLVFRRLKPFLADEV